MQFNQHHCKINFAAGLVVFLVALPLCLGIALASGAPPLSGIVSGIIGGIIIGFLSSSHISVSGPAAGLAAIVFMAIQQLGSFELFLCAVVIAGALQLLLGLLRAGSIAEYIPIAVIEGMLAGIGVIIVFKQLPYALGISHLADIHHLHWGAAIIALISLAILIVWEKVPVLARLKLLPSALFAVLVAILLNFFWQQAGSFLEVSANQRVNLPIPDHWQDLTSLLAFPNLKGFFLPETWITGVTIAIVASLETLLCIEASDRIDPYRRITDNNQELKAQGIGNMVCGLIGGLPVTSVIVRSSANVTAGATHKTATITHGVLLLICVLSMPLVLNQIPLAALAAVLILVGYKLAKPQTLLHFWHKGPYQFVPFLATMLAVVCLDLLKGVGIGLLISVFFILQGNMKRAYYLSREELENAHEITLDLAEEVSFLNKAAIKKTLKNIQPKSKLIINAQRTSYISTDVLELIEDFINYTAKEREIQVEILGFKHHYDKKQASHIHIGHRGRL
ncbi:carbonate dehydratase [Pasteurellaceae bacterium RH1A]|nr:carbonate dehydratase [Pasteurellaceae bacterium RH1A]